MTATPPPAPTTAPAAAPDPLAARLLDLLRLVNEWLRFAETKNVGMVGLASGGLTFIVVALGFLQDEGLGQLTGAALTVGAVLMALSLLASVWSFLPATSLPRWMRTRRARPRPDDNLFYFGHLANYHPRELVSAMARRYERHPDPDPDATDLQADLAAQVVVNARITMQKLKLFTWAVVLFAAGAVLAAGGILVVVLR
jgi:hypothetical protein